MSILVATMVVSFSQHLRRLTGMQVTEDELLYARIHENKLINYLYVLGE